jgi:hypothetical protein
MKGVYNLMMLEITMENKRQRPPEARRAVLAIRTTSGRPASFGFILMASGGLMDCTDPQITPPQPCIGPPSLRVSWSRLRRCGESAGISTACC